MKDEIHKVIVLPDLHCPEHDRKTLSAVEAYMREEGFDEVVYLGDLVNLSCISSFDRTKLRKLEGKTIQAEYDVVNRLLDRHQSMLPKADFTFLEGNHEERVERYLDEYPQLRGIIDIEQGLKLKERGIRWVRSWSKGECYELYGVLFLHGLFTGLNCAKRMVDAFGRTVYFGHDHSIQSFSKVIWGDKNEIIGQSLGCLCRLDQDYMRARPSNWSQGFGVFYFHGKNRYNAYVVRIQDHRFIAPNGKKY